MHKTIIIGITASIAAYKMLDIARNLREKGFEVYIVLSKSAVDFVPVMVLRAMFPNRVYLAEDALDQTDGQMLHIKLAKIADLVLIAPASADFISKIASGDAGCLLSSICLVTKARIAIAPAMNTHMWQNKFVQRNIALLKDSDIKILEPVEGLQICGDYGPGSMCSASMLIGYCLHFQVKQLLLNRKIIVTAGATREGIDPARFLSNYSSGKMGIKIAEVATHMGAEVTLMLGHSDQEIAAKMQVMRVESAEQMLNACHSACKDASLFISVAAICDYRPEIYANEKLKKNGERFRLNLIATQDVISQMKRSYPKMFCVGFAAETTDIIQHGKRKLIEKNLDMIAINDIKSQKVFGSEDNELHIITKQHQHYHLAKNNKALIAQHLLELICDYHK